MLNKEIYKRLFLLLIILLIFPKTVSAESNKFTENEILIIASALQGECEITLKTNTDTCYGVAFTIYNRYNKGYGSISNIIKSAYYGYKSNRIPKQIFIDIAIKAINMEDFTHGSLYAFSYPADVNYLGIQDFIPTYKTDYTWFFNYFPIGKSWVNQKAITPKECLRIGKCYYKKSEIFYKNGIFPISQ